MNNEKFIIAAFDFDGTITYCDTFIPFLLHVTGKLQFIRKIIPLIPRYIAFRLGFITNQQLKLAFVRSFLKGHNYAKLKAASRVYASSILPRMVRQEMIEKILWHRNQGHVCILVSASFNVYLDYWACNNGLEVISSKLEINKHGIVTGNIQGRNCYGPEKARLLKDWLKGRKPDYIYAYGDSKGDYDLLQMADTKIYRGSLIS